MSTTTTYRLVQAIALAQAAQRTAGATDRLEPSVVKRRVSGKEVLSTAVQATGRAVNQAAEAFERYEDEVRLRYSRLMASQQLQVRESNQGHLEDAVQELGYMRVPESAGEWVDHDDRRHEIQESFRGPRGEIGVTRVDDDTLIAYTRTSEAAADLHEVMRRYVQNVMNAHFTSNADRLFDVPTDDGGTLPTSMRILPGTETRLRAEVHNPSRDDRCVGAMARVRALFGVPVDERVRISRTRRLVRQGAEETVSQPAEVVSRKKLRITRTR